MKKRAPVRLPEHDYPVDEWRLIERRFSRKFLPRTETLFALSNGYLGLRGNLEEGRPVHDQGTLINGFHETWDIVHAEEAYGLAKTGQTNIDAPDATTIKLYVDDEPLFLPTAYLDAFERVLDMRQGVLERNLVWETASGKRVSVRSVRMVSMEQRHLAAFLYEVTVLNADAPVVISSQLINRQDTDLPDEPGGDFDPRASKGFDRRVLVNELRYHRDARVGLGYRVANSGMTLACGMDHHLDTDNEVRARTDVDGDVGKVVYRVDAQEGRPIRLVKYASYHSSGGVPTKELADRVHRTLDRAVAAGWEPLAASQRTFMADFWDRSDVRIEGQPDLQQAIRWNLFHLIQATARAEGTGVPAKGLTGHGYEGHYFWDVEIFVIPFLCYTEPRIARNLLRFRASMLDTARERARELGHAGALFPWRTITGEEASAYYQAGTAQYHLNADIAYAIKRYVDVTGDKGLLLDAGAEILVETARLWVDLGFYDDEDAFHLHAVTGPDEYTTVVNDNAFTNLMARLNLNYAVSVVDWLRVAEPYRYRVLCEDVGLTYDEVEAWHAAAVAMHVPFNEKRGINPQDAHFLEREVWDFARTPQNRYPLLLHYHPLVIYRHQVLKQADVVLAMFLLGNEFSFERKTANYRYYDPLTTSDSSLSPPVHAIVAAEIGDVESAVDHFRLALMMDIADVGANAHHGVHIASTGGVWMSLVYGFAGLRDFDSNYSFDPRLPAEWSRLSFPLCVSGQRIDVDLDHERMRFVLRTGDGLELTVRGEAVRLRPGEPAEVALMRQEIAS
jgi:alpha,alpha-trehalose phosphorylase